MNYSDQELQEVTSSLLPAIRRSDETGRRIDLNFTDLQKTAASVFVLEPGSIYYLVLLSSQRLLSKVKDAQITSAELVNSIHNLGFRSQSLQTTALQNAHAALINLSIASEARSSASQSLTATPAYRQFSAEIDRFLKSANLSIVRAGAVTETAEQSRAALEPLVEELRVTTEDIAAHAKRLSQAISSLESLHLPSALHQSLLDNAVSSIGDLASSLSTATPIQQAAMARAAALEAMAARSSLRALGDFNAPTTFAKLSGQGRVYADVTHPATPASLTTSLESPYSLVNASGSGTELDAVAEGGSLVLSLPGSFVARFESTLPEPFDTSAVTQSLRLGLSNWPMPGITTLVDAAYTIGMVVNAWTIATDLNTAIQLAQPGIPFVVEPYVTPLKYAGNPTIQFFGLIVFLIAPPGVDFTTLGLRVNDVVRVVDFSSANYGAIYRITAFAVGSVDMVIYHDVGPHTNNIAAVEIGGALSLRLRISTADDAPGEYRKSALDNRVGIVVSTTGPGTDVEQQGAANAIGFFPGLEIISRPTTAIEVADFVNASLSSSLTGTQRIKAVALFSSSLYSGAARTELTQATTVVLATFSSTALVTAGTNVIFTLPTLHTVTVGQAIVLRVSTIPTEIGETGIVTSVTDTTVSALMANAITAGAIEFEAGPDLVDVVDATVQVTGGPLAGEYVVKSQSKPFDLELRRPFSLTTLGGGQPIALSLAVGRYKLEFSSTDKTLASALELSTNANPNSAMTLLFGVGSLSSVGQTSYVLLPILRGVQKPEEGDQFELYQSQYNAPDFASRVQKLEGQIATLAASQLVTTSPFAFTTDSALPFARVRHARANNYDVLQVALQNWLNTAPALPAFFVELNRQLNPLRDPNPSAPRINEATSKAAELDVSFVTLTTIVSAYIAKRVAAIDDLLRAYREKGASRAIDLLLDLKLADLFVSTLAGSSYSGHVQEVAAAVMQSDLPVRKAERVQSFKTVEDKDFEFDHRDTDEAEVDIPTGIGDRSG